MYLLLYFEMNEISDDLCRVVISYLRVTDCLRMELALCRKLHNKEHYMKLKEWEMKFDQEKRAKEEEENLKDERLRKKDEEIRLRKHYKNNDPDEELPFQLESFDIDQSKKN